MNKHFNPNNNFISLLDKIRETELIKEIDSRKLNEKNPFVLSKYLEKLFTGLKEVANNKDSTWIHCLYAYILDLIDQNKYKECVNRNVRDVIKQLNPAKIIIVDILFAVLLSIYWILRSILPEIIPYTYILHYIVVLGFTSIIEAFIYIYLLKEINEGFREALGNVLDNISNRLRQHIDRDDLKKCLRLIPLNEYRSVADKTQSRKLKLESIAEKIRMFILPITGLVISWILSIRAVSPLFLFLLIPVFASTLLYIYRKKIVNEFTNGFCDGVIGKLNKILEKVLSAETSGQDREASSFIRNCRNMLERIQR